MSFDGILITEIFHSLQGETSLSGIPFAFIRLTGCNLRCTYCDSTYAFKGGTKYSIDKIIETIAPYQVKNVLVTGGEPLMQRNTPTLIRKLKSSGYDVSIETHGEVSIEPIAKDCRVVMDVKTPGSKMNRGFAEQNLKFLKPKDEIKFVLCNQEDYFFAKSWIENHSIPYGVEILFSPIYSPDVNHSKWIAEQMLKDHLPVRFQIQLHKVLWGNQPGV